MRVLVAPGSFGGLLPATEAAHAIAVGWTRRAPADLLTLAPMSDGGVGFVDAVHASLGGDVVSVPVIDMYGATAPGSVLVTEETAYVEAGQIVTSRSSPEPEDGERTTSVGVGQLLSAALATALSSRSSTTVRRIVVGVGPAGGRGASDGGAGLLAALGARSDPPDVLLDGVRGLATVTSVDLSLAVAAVAGVRLMLATDDEAPLLGLMGTTSASGVERGISPQRIQTVDAVLERFAALARHRAALVRGAGAGGGVGYGLLVLGGVKAPGLSTVADQIGLSERMAQHDLVLTGEAALDFSAGAGTLSASIASRAAAAVRPCVALAGRVTVGARETRALGIESAYGVEGLPAAERTGEAAADLAALAERVARTWSWSR